MLKDARRMYLIKNLVEEDIIVEMCEHRPFDNCHYINTRIPGKPYFAWLE